jgi:hypothetical protein
LLFILAELFDEYSLEYIAVEGKNRKLSIVYINTMDVYNILGASGYRFWQGKACYQFAKQLELACKKYTCQQYLTKKILIRLKKQRKIAGFWLNEATKQVLQYDVKMPSAISLENYFDLDKGVSGVEFGSDAGLAFIRLDMRVASLSDIGKIGLNNEGAGEKMPMQAHVVYGTDEAAPAPQARRRINPARVAVPAAVPATPQLQIEKWTIGSVVYSSDMEHVHMILGTEKHKNPIYVAHAMKEEDFGDSLIYLSFCRQIERARFASPKTDQGMFVTENQQKLTIKLLGANTGDVRCTARGFYTSKNGSHLYVVDTYGTHADQ